MSLDWMGLVERLGWALIHSVWIGAAAAGVHGGLMAVLRRRSAQARYAVSCAVLTLFIVGVAGAFVMLGSAEASKRADRGVTRRIEVEAAMGSGLLREESPVGGTTNSGATGRMAMGSENVRGGPPKGGTTNYDPPQGGTPNLAWRERVAWVMEPALPWVVGAWVVGVGLLGLWQFKGWLGLVGLRREARGVEAGLEERVRRVARQMRIGRLVGVMESALVRVPTVMGWWRPVILLPMGLALGLTAGQVEAILAHELAHIRRHDYLVNLVQTLVETLLFYHPATWVIGRRIRRERELCCDDVVMALGADGREYAESLLEVARQGMMRGAGLGMGATGRVSELRRRIARLVGEEGRGGSRQWPVVVVVALVVVGMALGMTLRGQGTESTTTAAVVQRVGGWGTVVEGLRMRVVQKELGKGMGMPLEVQVENVSGAAVGYEQMGIRAELVAYPGEGREVQLVTVERLPVQPKGGVLKAGEVLSWVVKPERAGDTNQQPVGMPAKLAVVKAGEELPLKVRLAAWADLANTPSWRLNYVESGVVRVKAAEAIGGELAAGDMLERWTDGTNLVYQERGIFTGDTWMSVDRNGRAVVIRGETGRPDAEMGVGIYTGVLSAEDLVAVAGALKKIAYKEREPVRMTDQREVTVVVSVGGSVARSRWEEPAEAQEAALKELRGVMRGAMLKVVKGAKAGAETSAGTKPVAATTRAYDAQWQKLLAKRDWSWVEAGGKPGGTWEEMWTRAEASRSSPNTAEGQMAFVRAYQRVVDAGAPKGYEAAARNEMAFGLAGAFSVSRREDEAMAWLAQGVERFKGDKEMEGDRSVMAMKIRLGELLKNRAPAEVLREKASELLDEVLDVPEDRIRFFEGGSQAQYNLDRIGADEKEAAGPEGARPAGDPMAALGPSSRIMNLRLDLQRRNKERKDAIDILRRGAAQVYVRPFPGSDPASQLESLHLFKTKRPGDVVFQEVVDKRIEEIQKVIELREAQDPRRRGAAAATQNEPAKGSAPDGVVGEWGAVVEGLRMRVVQKEVGQGMGMPLEVQVENTSAVPVAYERLFSTINLLVRLEKPGEMALVTMERPAVDTEGGALGPGKVVSWVVRPERAGDGVRATTGSPAKLPGVKAGTALELRVGTSVWTTIPDSQLARIESLDSGVLRVKAEEALGGELAAGDMPEKWSEGMDLIYEDWGSPADNTYMSVDGKGRAVVIRRKSVQVDPEMPAGVYEGVLSVEDLGAMAGALKKIAYKEREPVRRALKEEVIVVVSVGGAVARTRWEYPAEAQEAALGELRAVMRRVMMKVVKEGARTGGAGG